MRILITNTGPWGTGSGTLADGIMQDLESRGHDVMAFFPDTGLPGPGIDRYYGDPERYRIVRFPVNREGIHLYTFPLIIPDPNPRNYERAWTFRDMSPAQLDAYMEYIREELQAVIDDFQPEVIECQHIWAMDRIVEELGYHYVSVAHHSDQLGFDYDPRMRPVARRAAQHASYIFAISDYVRDEVLELYGVDPAKVITIHNGYDQSIFHPFDVDRRAALHELGIDASDDLPIIDFCGKVSATKGIDVLLKANHIIQREQPAHLLIAGSGDLGTFSDEARRSFCLDNVHLIGHREPAELARLHNAARLSVLPSRSEGFGIAALEAMACGIPLVATRTGGLARFAVGELAEPGDPASLAEAILRVLRLPERDYRMLCEENRCAAEPYSIATNVDRRLPYYEQVAGLNRGRLQGTR